jgi:hypothetical protein
LPAAQQLGGGLGMDRCNHRVRRGGQDPETMHYC